MTNVLMMLYHGIPSCVTPPGLWDQMAWVRVPTLHCSSLRRTFLTKCFLLSSHLASQPYCPSENNNKCLDYVGPLPPNFSLMYPSSRFKSSAGQETSPFSLGWKKYIIEQCTYVPTNGPATYNQAPPHSPSNTMEHPHAWRMLLKCAI